MIQHMPVKTRRAYDFLSSVNREAYNRTYLLSNQVLSRNPYTNNFLKRSLQCGAVPDPGVFLILYKLLGYYLLSLKDFSVYLFGFIEYYFPGLGFRHKANGDELILIDTFFNVEKIVKDGSYQDTFFNGLASLLKRSGKEFAYLPVFYRRKRGTGMLDLFKIIKKQGLPAICEYQLLNGADLLRILYFIAVYPFSVLRLAYSRREPSPENKILKSELIITLNQVTFTSFARYLQGNRIARLPYKKIKVISWYENQVIHKNLYKGLRTRGDKVWICGAQLLIYSPNDTYIIVDESEGVFGILPDKILVNGPRFLPESSRLNYSVGPSLRYCSLLSGEIGKTSKEYLIAALPYLPKEEMDNFLTIINDATGQLKEKMLIKNHPALNASAYVKTLLPAAHITDQNLYDLFKKAKIIIGGAGGTLVEAVSFGIPAIYLKNNTGIEFNPLPEYGKGIIWDEASSAEELKVCIKKLETALEHHADDINDFAYRLRKDFFSQCDEESIRKAFELG